MPFFYEIYRMGVKRYMKNNFPQEGWETEWVFCDRHQIVFNLHRCLYADVTAACGCPELCCVYCENDDIAFSGLMPKIQFRRSGDAGRRALPAATFISSGNSGGGNAVSQKHNDENRTFPDSVRIRKGPGSQPERSGRGTFRWEK